MDREKLQNLEGGKITENELDAIYLYLDINADSLSEEDMSFWLEILQRIDPKFYED